VPLAKIHVLEGQYDEARLGRVSSAVPRLSLAVPRRSDLLTMLYETSGENISFGRGLAQTGPYPGQRSRGGVRRP